MSQTQRPAAATRLVWYVVDPPRPRRERLRAPLAVIGGLGLATVAIALRDPHEPGSWGFCPSAALGFYCPGCGGLRAVHDLTRGQVAEAASSNLALLVLGPVAVLLLARWVLVAWTGRRPPPRPRRTLLLGTVVLTALVLFMLARNLPGSWLAP